MAHECARRGRTHLFVRCIRVREYPLPLKVLRSRIKTKREDVGHRASFRLFSPRWRPNLFRLALRNSAPDTFTLVGDHESRVAQLLELARQQARVAKALAAPRTREALTELDYILEDQVAALANATDDDKADAATWAA
jgi:hypothetical protein